nr:MAG TPA: hypothetical protein [Caudoviricetes sp.]
MMSARRICVRWQINRQLFFRGDFLRSQLPFLILMKGKRYGF